MAQDQTAPEVRVTEGIGATRRLSLSLDGQEVARLYTEVFDEGGVARSESRLVFEGDVGVDVMRRVLEAAARALSDAPLGVCTVYRGHLSSSFSYGG